MSVDYEPLTISRSFPKIAVICGAHTELGQHLLRELLHSPEIDIVHAIATQDIPLLNRLSSSLLRKARVHLLSFDRLDRALAKIDEADVAFCCLSTDKHAYNIIGHTRFRTLNHDAPVRFVRKMFELGVLYVAVLSHTHADSSSRSELYKLRGDLEDFVRRLRREAADFSPFISMFKVYSLVSHSASGSSKSSAKDSHSALEYRDVAKAMRIDALQKSARRKNPTSRKRRSKYEEIDATDIERLLKDAKHEKDEYERGAPFWQ